MHKTTCIGPSKISAATASSAAALALDSKHGVRSRFAGPFSCLVRRCSWCADEMAQLPFLQGEKCDSKVHNLNLATLNTMVRQETGVDCTPISAGMRSGPLEIRQKLRVQAYAPLSSRNMNSEAQKHSSNLFASMSREASSQKVSGLANELR